MTFEIINPEALGVPKGWNHGILTPKNGRILFVAGQTASQDGTGGPLSSFPDQFARALDKILTVVREAGGEPSHVARLTIYVTDLAAYRASLSPLAEIWRARFGRHYPAMALLEVKGLVDREAVVEIEATAVLEGER